MFTEKTHANKNNMKGNRPKEKKQQKFQPKTFKMYIHAGMIYVNSKIMTDIIPAFKVIAPEIIDDIFVMQEYTCLDHMASEMLRAFNANRPVQQADGENSYWAINMASNRISLKTDGGYQFGWLIKYNKERTDYESVEFFYTAYAVRALPEDDSYSKFWAVEE